MIPKTIQVLNYEYRIISSPDLSEFSNCDGLCDPNERKIYIQSGLPKDKTMRVLVHELLHAVQVEAGFYDILETQAQELLAETLSGFFCAILDIKFKGQ